MNNISERRKEFAKVYGFPAGNNINREKSFVFKNIIIVFTAVIVGIFYLGYNLNLFLMALSPKYYAKFVNAMHAPLPQAIIMSLVIVGAGLLFRFTRRVDQQLKNELTGIEGENRVGRELDFLPADYTVFHSVIIPGKDYDIDHIVVGPCGVMVIETKKWNTKVKVVKNQLEYDKAKYKRDPLSQISNQAIDLKSYLEGITGMNDLWVQGVLCFVGENLSGATRDRIDSKWYVTNDKNLLDTILNHRQKTIPDMEKGMIIAKLSDLCKEA